MLQGEAGKGGVPDALRYNGERGGEAGDAVPGQLVQVVAARQEPQKGKLFEPEGLGPHFATSRLEKPPGALFRTKLSKFAL